MSKKTMKRSLALGALMAFVITGSAMAADFPINAGDKVGLTNAEADWAVISQSDLSVDAKLVITSNGNSISAFGNSDNTAAQMSVTTKGLDVTTVNGTTVFVAGDHQNMHLTINTQGNDVKINGTGQAHGIAVKSEGGSATINAGDIEVTATENAVYAREDGAAITLNGADVTIVSTNRGETADSKGHAVYVDKNAQVNIDATGDVTLKAVDGKYAIGIESGDLLPDAVVNVIADGNVDVDGQVFVDQEATINVEGKKVTVDTDRIDAVKSVGGTVNVTATDALAIKSLQNDGVQVDEGSAELTGKEVAIEGGKYGVKACGNNSSDINVTATEGAIKVVGAEGAIYSEGAAHKVSLSAANGVELTGKVFAGNGGSVAIDAGAGDVEVTGQVENNFGGTVSIKGNNVTLSNEGADTVKSIGRTINIEAAKDLTITNVGKDGIQVDNGSAKLTAGGDVNITADAWGINNIAGGPASKVEVVGQNVTVTGAEGGVRTLYKGGNVSLTASNEAKVNGGIFASNGQIDVAAKDIVVNANEFYGVRAGTSTNDFTKGNGYVVLGDDSTETVSVKGDTDYAIIARAADNSGAEDVQSSVVVNGKNLIIGSVEDGDVIYAGITAASGTEVQEGYNSSSVIVNTAYTEINAENGIYNMSNGNVTVNGDLTINATKSAIVTRGYADTIINKEASKDITVKLNGDIEFNKYYDNDYSVTDSNVVLNLANADSYLNGNIIVTNDSGVDPVNHAKTSDITGMALGLSNGATWYVTEDSFVNTLTGDGGIIEVDDFDTDVTVTTDEADNLIVQQSGKNADEFADVAAQSEQLNNLANVVKTEGEDGVAVANVVAIKEGSILGKITADVSVDEDGKTVVSNVKEATNTVNDAIGEAGVALKAHWRAHMNDMNKRMGELRNANGEHGVWTRMVRGEAEYESTKAQYNQYQLGYDEKVGDWTVGAAVTYAEGDSAFGIGSSEDDSTAFAIYGSKLNKDGSFVDVIARYAKIESDVTVGAYKDDYDTDGYSVSAEYGKRFAQNNGLWIEPQVELTYGSVDSAEYKLGTKNVSVGEMDSFVGRVGFSLGKDIKQGNVYARASYLYDFEGETETTFSNAGLSRTIKEDLGGGWWEVGVGANINLSKATYIYADIEKTFGGEVDTNWQWNLGVRYSF